MYKRWRKTGGGREREREREKKIEGDQNNPLSFPCPSSLLVLSSLPPFLSVPLCLCRALFLHPSLALFSFLCFFLSPSTSVPLCLYLHPSFFFSPIFSETFPFNSCPRSWAVVHSLFLCFHFFPPLSIIHSFHVFLCLSFLTPFCLTISLPLLWL